MENKYTKEILDKQRYEELINKIGPDVFSIFKQIKEDLGGRLPAELSYGIVAGFLRGKGFTWEESFIGMDRFIETVSGIVGQPKDIQGSFTIMGKEDGSVETNLKENKV